LRMAMLARQRCSPAPMVKVPAVLLSACFVELHCVLQPGYSWRNPTRAGVVENNHGRLHARVPASRTPRARPPARPAPPSASGHCEQVAGCGNNILPDPALSGPREQSVKSPFAHGASVDAFRGPDAGQHGRSKPRGLRIESLQAPGVDRRAHVAAGSKRCSTLNTRLHYV
jgi:hypothetical protein